MRKLSAYDQLLIESQKTMPGTAYHQQRHKYIQCAAATRQQHATKLSGKKTIKIKSKKKPEMLTKIQGRGQDQGLRSRVQTKD